MRILCVFGQHNYGDPARGEGYEYVNFIPTLRRLGHEVLFLESWDRTRYRDFAELNEKLLRTVEETRPDVVFSVMFAYEIWLETLEVLRDAGIAATVNWTTDDSWRYRQFSRLVAPSFDAFTTTYPSAFERYGSDGIHNVQLTQWAASSGALRRPLPCVECTIPVSFVGTAHGSRTAWVQMLASRGVDVRCFGHGWPSGAIPAEEIPRIIRSSVISLNFANSAWAFSGMLPRRSRQIKARTFEVPGAGGFLLSEWVDGLDAYLAPGHEIETFRTADEAAEKIRFYLMNPGRRDAIARAGYERTAHEHTYDRRLGEMLTFAVRRRELRASCNAAKPSGKIDWGRFELAVEGHRAGRGLTAAARALKGVCSLVWGRKRGPRAARRFTYELSWRLGGARTYRAVGLPGRLFYHES
jgi:spore maturation protein CgeB